MNNMRVTNNTV